MCGESTRRRVDWDCKLESFVNKFRIWEVMLRYESILVGVKGLYNEKCISPLVFGQIEFVPQVAHDRDTYATSNISP